MAPFRHVVVVIPGILGSVLTKDGKPVWDFSLHALGNAIAGSGLAALALPGPDLQDEDLGDGVIASDILSNMEAFPNLWRTGGYSRLRERLKAVEGLTLNENLFMFPFDWRRDNRVAARKLAKESGRWLSTWREKTDNSSAKLVLIAHSMGGLVASHFMECLEGWRDTHTLINIGVPFRGAGAPLDMFANGPFGRSLSDRLWGNAAERLTQATDAFRSMDSLYQMLPTYPFLTRQDGPASYIHEADITGVDRSRVVTARGFHDEVFEAHRVNLGVEGYSNVRVRNVIGTRQRTIQSASLTDGALEVRYQEADGTDKGGDSSVPRVSATAIYGSEDNATFIANSHAALPSDDVVFEQVSSILAGAEIDLSKYRDTASGAKISLRLPSVALADEPIEISATASSHRLQYLVAEVRNEVGHKSTVRLFPDGNSFTNRVKLAPGLHWLTVTGAGAAPVSDVLVVMSSS